MTAATVAPAAVTALPFLLWHPGDFLTDAVACHLFYEEDIPATALFLAALGEPGPVSSPEAA